MLRKIEIEFKGNRKAFYSNPEEFPFIVGDLVIVEADKGEDIGQIVNIGSLVDKRAKDKDCLKILRKPNSENIAKLHENRNLEKKAFENCLKRIESHGLEMKLVDVEYQFDRKKITFYFTSDSRVDFRALVRDLASHYKTRIELRQIGVRDEAKRIGGLGICGYPLCCTTFLRNFDPVITQYAKDQNLAINPTKLSGCCGRLMCCLKYEEDFYKNVREYLPEIGIKIKTKTGTGRLKRIYPINDIAIIEYENDTREKITLDELKMLTSKKDKSKQHKKYINKKDPKGERNKKNSGH